jgi:hypothetical protein
MPISNTKIKQLMKQAALGRRAERVNDFETTAERS